jgi:hypothetical protein
VKPAKRLLKDEPPEKLPGVLSGRLRQYACADEDRPRITTHDIRPEGVEFIKVLDLLAHWVDWILPGKISEQSKDFGDGLDLTLHLCNAKSGYCADSKAAVATESMDSHQVA